MGDPNRLASSDDGFFVDDGSDDDGFFVDDGSDGPPLRPRQPSVTPRATGNGDFEFETDTPLATPEGYRAGRMTSLPTVDVAADPSGSRPSRVSTRGDGYEATTFTPTPRGVRNRAESEPAFGGVTPQDVEQFAGDALISPAAAIASRVSPSVRRVVDRIVSPETRRDYAAGFRRGLTSDFEDELVGAGAQAVTDPGRASVGQFGADYDLARDAVRDRQHEAAARSPIANTAGSVVGGLAQLLMPVGHAARATTALGRIGQGALAGAGLGGVAGYGGSESEDLGGQALDTAEGAGVGGLFGTGIAAVGEGIGAGVRALRGRAATRAAQSVPELEKIADEARAATIYGTRRAGIGDALSEVSALPGGPAQMAGALRRNNAAIDSGTVDDVARAVGGARERVSRQIGGVFEGMRSAREAPYTRGPGEMPVVQPDATQFPLTRAEDTLRSPNAGAFPELPPDAHNQYRDLPVPDEFVVNQPSSGAAANAADRPRAGLVDTRPIAEAYEQIAQRLGNVTDPDAQAVARDFLDQAQQWRGQRYQTLDQVQDAKSLAQERLQSTFRRDGKGGFRSSSGSSFERDAERAIREAMDGAVDASLGPGAAQAYEQARRDLQALTLADRRSTEAARRSVQGGPGGSLTAQIQGQGAAAVGDVVGGAIAGPLGQGVGRILSNAAVGSHVDAQRALRPVLEAVRAEQALEAARRTAEGVPTATQRVIDLLLGEPGQRVARRAALPPSVRRLLGEQQ